MPTLAALKNHRINWAVAAACGMALLYYASSPEFLFTNLFLHRGQALHELLKLDDSPYSWLREIDYSFRMAGALLHGKLGMTETPPSWLNEMIPVAGNYYCVFALGSVLTMVPLALLDQLGLLWVKPSGIAIALIAAAATLLCNQLVADYGYPAKRRALLTLFVLIGSCLWPNLVMSGAWQLTLGFALIGELGAIYYSTVKRDAFLAGAFFAFAFGNRTEVILVAPVLAYLLLRDSIGQPIKEWWPPLLKFSIVPFILGTLTLAYNFARFGSPFDFGLAKIPGVAQEPWYQQGIFSLSAIGWNIREMLIIPWNRIDQAPYFLPTGFGGSIFLNSPFLLLIFRPRTRDRRITIAAWSAILLLTLCYWFHGNAGGWQFSYRSVITILPWFLLLLLENSPDRVTRLEILLLAASIAINAWGLYLMLWTNLVTP